MSYAIVRNEKLTRDEAKGRYVHNERSRRRKYIICSSTFR